MSQVRCVQMRLLFFGFWTVGAETQSGDAAGRYKCPTRSHHLLDITYIPYFFNP